MKENQVIQGRILSLEEIAPRIYKIWIQAPETAASARPGMFVNLYPEDGATLLPRPISICQVAGDQIGLVFRAAGKGTEELAKAKNGDPVRLSTSLGNGFAIQEAGVSVLIGGGVGVPPLVALAQEITGPKIAVLGFAQDPFLIQELEDAGCEVHVALEGRDGTVLDLMKAKGIRGDAYYACGPKAMLYALASWCEQRGQEIQVSMEERMGCGYGACVGCTCDTKGGRKKVCLDGPVFWGSQIQWEETKTVPAAPRMSGSVGSVGSDQIDLGITLCGVPWSNPISTASGTFAPLENGTFYDLNVLGAMITKGVALEPWNGNPTPRIAETPGGMLNAIGLENPGIEEFLRRDLPLYKSYAPRTIVNVVGKTIESYCAVVERLDETDADMLEINVSCPNIKEGGISFGTMPEVAAALTREIRKRTTKPFLVKLTPNVTDLTEVARAVEAEGADGVSLINTLLGMRIDVNTGKPILANRLGGLSGPAIKPVAVGMVYRVRRAVKIPILGLGGIMTGEDVAEFLMAGADAVSIGTASFADPIAPLRIRDELVQFMERKGYATIQELKDSFQED